MKFIVGVVTFAAAQLQISNFSLREPDYKMLNDRVSPQIRVSKKNVTTDTKLMLSLLILGASVIGSTAFLAGRRTRKTQNLLVTA